MRHLRLAALALAAAGALGCSNGATTDPTKLPPLTEADFAEIKARDASIDEEEGQSFSALPRGKARQPRSDAMDR